MLSMLKWLPDGYGGVSSYAGDIDAVFSFIYWLTFAIFWLVTILMVVFLILGAAAGILNVIRSAQRRQEAAGPLPGKDLPPDDDDE